MRKKSKVAQGAAFAFDLHTNKNLGQHFLHDDNYTKQIVHAANMICPANIPQKKAIEIGPGSGALTKLLLADGWHIDAIEKDERAIEGLKNTLAVSHADQFTITNCDILKLKLDTLNYQTRAQSPQPLPVCIGNIPYYITSDILLWMSENRKYFSGAVFMVQDEVADRLQAKPGTKPYGRLSVRLQLTFSIKKLFVVPSSAFSPPPKVNSAVVTLQTQDFEFENEEQDKAFSGFTTLLFGSRRKMLRRALAETLNNLKSAKDDPEHSAFWDWAKAQGFTGETRPDTLTPNQILNLFLKLKKH